MRKPLESNVMALKMEQGDMLIYINYLFQSFHSLAETKAIKIEIVQETATCIMDFDQEKIQVVFSNLFSNAIKFTPNGRFIHLFIAKTKENKLSIKINDTGSGIPKADLPYIFDRFYQVDDSATRQGEGTGIGLALTKELVELMNGTIKVDSVLGKGTSFTILLPITNKAPLINNKPLPDPSAMTRAFPLATSTTALSATEKEDPTKDRLLIIEDNVDVALYLKDCLETTYQLYFAQSGQEGIDKAIQLVPDIIISDVMMPKKDGFEVTQYLKNEERTSHIPIILLTAKADIASKIKGLEHGADAYLKKPFLPKELQVRLEKLVESRRKLQTHFAGAKAYNLQKMVAPKPATTVQKSIHRENAFLLKVNKILDKYLSDADLDIATICQELYMSQSQLYRKIKALTGKSIVAYLRAYRLHKAKKLLQDPKKSITDIAYYVGFSDSRYFSRQFSNEFGSPPRANRD